MKSSVIPWEIIDEEKRPREKLQMQNYIYTLCVPEHLR